MADNVAVTEGAGKTVRTDDVGGFQYQMIKVAIGGDGVAADVVGGAGASNAGTIRVIHASDDPVLSANTQLPAALGGNQAAANSFGVGLSTEDIARLGIITEAAPGTDTASSGLNGRLQRIAQRITSWIALFTATAAGDANRLPVDLRDGLALAPAFVTATGVIFTQDMTGYGSITVQVTVAGVATISYEHSDDNVTWYAAQGVPAVINNQTSQAGSSTTLTLLRFGKFGKYFRARCSAYTSGNVTVVATVHQTPFTAYLNAGNVGAQIYGGQVAHDSAISGTPVRVAARARNVGLPYAAVSVDDVTDLVTNLIGHLKVTKEYAFAYLAATNGAGAAVKASAGVLHTVNVNTAVATATLSIYDAASATNPIAIIDCGTGARTIVFDVVFATGLYWVLAGANANVTVTYN